MEFRRQSSESEKEEEKFLSMVMIIARDREGVGIKNI